MEKKPAELRMYIKTEVRIKTPRGSFHTESHLNVTPYELYCIGDGHVPERIQKIFTKRYGEGWRLMVVHEDDECK